MFASIERFREKLSQGQVCLGAEITFTDPAVTDALGASVEFLWIDLEHSMMSPEALQGHLLAARAHGVPALVRVTAAATPFIKPILDAGAEGIITPQIRTAAEVQQVVADCRYPPQGRRGFGPRPLAAWGRLPVDEYLLASNRSTFVVVQIETAEALEALDEIVAVPGIDSLLIGPWDLSGALGVLGQVEHPLVLAAEERVIAAAHAAGLWVGGAGGSPEYTARFIQRGVDWIHVGVDYDLLLRRYDDIAEQVRARLAQP